MTLADDIRVGARIPKAPSWVGKDDGIPAQTEIATVIYIHPEGRYCTVRFANGLTDTVQTVPAAKALHKQGEPLGGAHRNRSRPNVCLRDRLRIMGVHQTAVSVAMGHGPTWLSRQLDRALTAEERQEIIQAAEHIAAERSEA